MISDAPPRVSASRGRAKWRPTWIAALTLLCSVTKTGFAQQYITDDAAITEFRACQIQMWHGERSSWILPVCTPVKNLELSLGLLAVRPDNADTRLEYVAQFKTLLKPLTSNSWGAGFAAGTGRDLTSPERGNEYSIYAYVPFSKSLWNDRLVLHENIGWSYVHREPHWDNSLSWATRAEIKLDGRIGRGMVGVAEIYGAERIERHDTQTRPEYQAGLRTWLRPDRVQLDLSFGRTLRRPFAGNDGPGWTIGLALTTPPFL